jgi:hypothetical protein
MSAAATHTAALALSVPAFPAGVDARWETQNRTVWKERQHELDCRARCLASLSDIAAEGVELKR